MNQLIKLRQIKNNVNLPKSLPKINIGKAGLSPNVIKEVDRQLEEHEFVKIKFFRSALTTDDSNKKNLFVSLASSVNAKIIDERGFTVILYRKRRLYKR